MNARQRRRFPIVGGEHVLVVGPPDAARREIREDVFAAQQRNGLAVVDEPASDRIAAGRIVRVLNDRIGWHDELARRSVADLQRNAVVSRQRRRRVVRLQQLVALAQAVPVVGAFADDVHGLPRVETDRVHEQVIVGRVRRIERPVQPVRIPEAVRPDFLSRAARGHERVVVRNPVAAVLADRARRDVLVQVGNDAEDLAFERVEPLRVGPDRRDL